jgi:uncharacterized protein (TIGR03437 family)
MSFSVSEGRDWLNATIAAGLTPVEMTVSIKSQPPAGTYKGSIVLTPTAPDLPAVTIPITYVITNPPPARPVISSAVNAASFQTGVAANSWATVLGTNLASTTDSWNNAITNGPLPTSLDGVTVTFDGKPAYLSYISPTQINLVVPNIRSNQTAVVVSNNGAKPTGLFTTPASPNGPAFFPWPNNQVVATHRDYSYAVKNGTFASLSTAPAKPGDVIILWGTGFGATTPAAPLGYVTPSDQTYSSTLPTITIGGMPATVYGAALASGFVGLYQVAIQVPGSLGDGDWPVVASVLGAQSANGMVLSVHK